MANLLNPGTLLTQLRKDVERNSMRLRNGIKVAGGFDSPDLGISAKDIVWQEDRAQLWHYKSDSVKYAPPVLIIYSLLNRSYILDLHPGNSTIEGLLNAGHDVYMLDWGVADENDANNTVEDYVLHYIGQCVDVVRKRSGEDKINLFGYCLGGVFALLHTAATKSKKINSLVSITTPVDLHNQGIYSDLLLEDRFNIDEWLDESGNVPASAIARVGSMMKPTSKVMNYVNLLDKMWSDEYVFAWRAITRWANDNIPFAGACARQMSTMFVQENGMVHDTIRLNGKKISFKDITCPFLSVRATDDHIVPPKSTEPLMDIVGSKNKREKVIKAGHVGIFIGSAGKKHTIPSIVDFLNENSRPLDLAAEA